MCHRASEATAWQCSCGYEFGQHVEKVREMLRTQLRTSWISLAACLFLDVAMVALATVGSAIALFGLVGLLGATGRSLRKILVSRESLRQLAPAELPTARLLT
jgi:hypothetical protein